MELDPHGVLCECLLDCNGDVEAAFAAAEAILSERPLLPPVSDPPIDALLAHDISNRRAQGILNRTLRASRGLTAAARRDLTAALRARGGGEAILRFIDKYRLQLARLLTTTQLAALLEGASEVAAKVPTLTTFPGAIPPPPTLEPAKAVALVERLEKLPPDKQAEEIVELPAAEQVYVRQAIAARAAQPPPPPNMPPIVQQRTGGGAPEDVHLVTIDEAVRGLASRNVIDRPAFDALDAVARAKAFTVANVSAEETLTKIRDSLAENVRDGTDYEAWRKKVMEDVDQGTFLSDAHQETVFRTNVQTSFSDGQKSVLDHPLVRGGFPYSVYDAIHDDRVRENHLALEKHGIGGTNVYRNDDPVFQLFRPPWDYNDRCSWTPITVRHAAERGIKEAQVWLETGTEPEQKAWVPMPPFAPPPGFQRAVAAAPMSIRLSMQSVATFASVQSGNPEEETDTAILYGAEVGTITEGALDTAADGPNKTARQAKTKRGRRHRGHKRRGLFRRLRVKRRWVPAAALSVDAASGQHSDREERLGLIAGILVLLFDGRAIEIAKQLRSNNSISLGMVGEDWHGPTPPNDNWVLVGRGPHGGKIWRHRKTLERAPVSDVGYKRPRDVNPKESDVGYKHPAPTAQPTAQGEQGKYVEAHQQRSANATIAYDSAMSSLKENGTIATEEKVTLAKHLSVMGKGQLKSLYAALGGSAAIVGTERQPWVHAIKDILSVTTKQPAVSAAGGEPPPQPVKNTGGQVATETGGPNRTAANQGGVDGGEPTGQASPQRVPASIERVNQKLDQFSNLFRSRGQHEAAGWMESLRNHVNSVGVEDALEALGPEVVGGGENTQYGGAQEISDFATEYLSRNGISLVAMGDRPEAAGPRVVSSVAPSKEGIARRKSGQAEGDVHPALQTFKNKLEEMQHLPGLESSQDLGDLMGTGFGSKVSHFTPAVVKKLDEMYGKGRWIVRPYTDEAYAGYGIFFPDRVKQIKRDAQNTILASNNELTKYGFHLTRDDETNQVIGIEHHGGDTYLFSSDKYNSTIQGDARHWADKAAGAASSEHGVDIDHWSPKAEGGRTGESFPTARFMVSPAFQVVGISNEERAQGVTFKKGQEGRVHIHTKNGKAEIIPHSTWLKKEPMPVVFESDDTRAMAQAAVDAINALPESERKGQLYAPDIVKTTDGYKVVEANPANEAGASGYLADNPFVIDAYTSYITGREPAHVKFIRRLLSKRVEASASTESTKLSIDRGGHEHRGKGPGGGQFVKKGGYEYKGQPLNLSGWDLIGQYESDVGSWLLRGKKDVALLEVPEGLTVADVKRAVGDSNLKYISASHEHWDHIDQAVWEKLRKAFPKAEIIHPKDVEKDKKLDLDGEELWLVKAPKHSPVDVVTVFRGVAMTGDIELGTLDTAYEEVPRETRKNSMDFLAKFQDRTGHKVHTIVSAHLDDVRKNVNWQDLFKYSAEAALATSATVVAAESQPTVDDMAAAEDAYKMYKRLLEGK